MDKIDRGRRAKGLLDDEILTEALDELERSYTAAWRNARTLEARENAHRLVSLLDRLKEDLASQVLTGTLNAKRRAELEGRERFWR